MALRGRSLSEVSRQRSRKRKAKLEALSYEINRLAKSKMKAYRQMRSVFKKRRTKVKELRRLILEMQQVQRQRARKRRKHRKEKSRKLFQLLVRQMDESLNAKKAVNVAKQKKKEHNLQKELRNLKKLAQKTPQIWKHFKGYVKRLELAFAGLWPMEDVKKEGLPKRRVVTKIDASLPPTKDIFKCSEEMKLKQKAKTHPPRIVHLHGPYKVPKRTKSPARVESPLHAFNRMRQGLKSRTGFTPIGSPAHVKIPDDHVSSTSRSHSRSGRHGSSRGPSHGRSQGSSVSWGNLIVPSNFSITPSPEQSPNNLIGSRRRSPSRNRSPSRSRTPKRTRTPVRKRSPSRGSSRRASPSRPLSKSAKRKLAKKLLRKHKTDNADNASISTESSEYLIRLVRNMKKDHRKESIPITSWKAMEKKRSTGAKYSDSSNQLHYLLPPRTSSIIPNFFSNRPSTVDHDGRVSSKDSIAKLIKSIKDETGSKRATSVPAIGRPSKAVKKVPSSKQVSSAPNLGKSLKPTKKKKKPSKQVPTSEEEDKVKKRSRLTASRLSKSVKEARPSIVPSVHSNIEDLLNPVKHRLTRITNSMTSFISDFNVVPERSDEGSGEPLKAHSGAGDGQDSKRDSFGNYDAEREAKFEKELEEHLKNFRLLLYNGNFDEFQPNEDELRLLQAIEFKNKTNKPKPLTKTLFTDELEAGNMDPHLNVMVGDKTDEYKKVYQLLLQKDGKDGPINWSDQQLLHNYARTPSRYNRTLKRLYDFRVFQSHTPFERSLLELDYADTQSLLSRRERQLRMSRFSLNTNKSYSESEDWDDASSFTVNPSQYDIESLRRRWQEYFAVQEKSPIELLLEQQRQEKQAEKTRRRMLQLKLDGRQLQRRNQHHPGYQRFRSRSRSRSQSRRSSRETSLDRLYTNPRRTSRERTASLLGSATSLLYKTPKKRSVCSICGLSYCGTDSDSHHSSEPDKQKRTETLINQYKYLRLR